MNIYKIIEYLFPKIRKHYMELGYEEYQYLEEQKIWKIDNYVRIELDKLKRTKREYRKPYTCQKCGLTAY